MGIFYSLKVFVIILLQATSLDMEIFRYYGQIFLPSRRFLVITLLRVLLHLPKVLVIPLLQATSLVMEIFRYYVTSTFLLSEILPVKNEERIKQGR